MSTKFCHFDNHNNVHISYEKYEENGCGLDLDFLAICVDFTAHILGELG